ncbi:BAG family molecular chaperone regulator 1 [Dorcoceras hygrometricum]|uniref:BAG family molecular chaperone regulator 1 n=1 Tax=Dorcoceras hygrometricum TaxID=472368 RepID=A0A2Z7DJW8_9LAMI|nr:BAG family molecular chaperone regulator 1 [Dorcoceras hygrometricum]
MMRMTTKNEGLPTHMNGGSGGGAGGERIGGGEKAWELRPGGMLVQKRTEEDNNSVPPPIIRVRVKYGSIYHEMRISSQATFGELKKMLSGPTGLHHQDQKLFYKDKERDSKVFLDTVGVKDKSKMVLQEDPISQEKRFIEMRKTAKMEKSAKFISEISLEVDRLAGQVSLFETIISKGAKVDDKDLTKLIELLMNQLLKLDAITADGDVKLQRKMQVRRVQKYVETLDMLKITSKSSGNNTPLVQPTTPTQGHGPRNSNGDIPTPIQPHRSSNGSVSSLIELQQSRNSFGSSFNDSPKQQQSRHSASGAAVVITTQWETFDSAPTPQKPTLSATPSTSTTANRPLQPHFTWDLL